MLPTKVIQANGPFVLAKDLADTPTHTGRAIIFRTNNSFSGLAGKPGYSSEYVYLSSETAQNCLVLGASLGGCRLPIARSARP